MIILNGIEINNENLLTKKQLLSYIKKIETEEKILLARIRLTEIRACIKLDYISLRRKNETMYIAGSKFIKKTLKKV